MNKYEVTILHIPDTSNKLLEDEIKLFKDNIESSKGKIIGTEDWGLRELTYIINGYKKSFYNFFQIEIDGNKISEIKNNLNQNENIIRYLFVKVNTHQELPTKMKNEEK